jgi:anthranilate phosphoribosyltransferase
MSEIRNHIKQLLKNQHLSQDQMARVVQMIMVGGVSPIQIGAIVSAIQTKTPSHLEIYGTFDMMRKKIRIIEGHDDVINVSIGSHSDLENEAVSIVVMLILASLECRSAKFLNKISSNSHDIVTLVEKLGCPTDKNIDFILKAIEVNYLSISYSPIHTHIFRDIIQVMQDLGFYGIFDIANSLLTPVNCSYHLIGLENANFIRPVVESLGMMDVKCAWVVNSSDLGDIISTEEKTSVTQIKDGVISSFEIDPKSLDYLDNADESHKILYVQEGEEVAFYSEQIYKLLKNQSEFLSFKKLVLLNAAAAIMVRGLTNDFQDAIRITKEILANGDALRSFNRHIENQ